MRSVRGKFIDLIGQNFGRWTVIERANKDKGTYWKCLCNCGNIRNVKSYELRSGNSKSCGCLHMELVKKNNVKNSTHNMSDTRFYIIWNNIKQRCINKNSSGYYKYGAKGITVCDRWLKSFENFRDDMYESYLRHVEEFGEKQTTIDRIEVSGNYEPLNCKWATNKEQANNKGKQCNQKYFKAISPNGEEFIDYNKRKFCRENNLHVTGVNKCIGGKLKCHKEWFFKEITKEIYDENI